jgi:hypothetical protein
LGKLGKRLGRKNRGFAMPLYTDNIAIDTVSAVKGWWDTVKAIRTADLTKITDQGARMRTAIRRQLLDQIIGRPLADVLSRTDLGARQLAITTGQDPKQATLPGADFKINYNGKTSYASLPDNWQTTLIVMHCRGIDVVPKLEVKDLTELENILDNNKPILSTGEKVDNASAVKFLGIMKNCNVTVVQKPDPVSGQVADQDQAVKDALAAVSGYTQAPPELANEADDPRVAAVVSSEYAKLPAPVGGGDDGDGGGGDEVSGGDEGGEAGGDPGGSV